MGQTQTLDNPDVVAPDEQMDAEGILLPDARESLLAKLASAEPLLESDPILRDYMNRFLSQSGVGSGRYRHEIIIACGEFFADLEGTLVQMLQKGSEEIIQPEAIGSISSLIENLKRAELCLMFARCGYLSAELFHRTEEYLQLLAHGVSSICDSLMSESQSNSLSSTVLEAIGELRDLPQRMRRSVALRFKCSDLSEVQPGDIISSPDYGRTVVLSFGSDGRGDFISYSISHNRYERFTEDLEAVSPMEITIARGIEQLALSGEKPFSRRQPFCTAVHVMRAPGLPTKRSYEKGEIIGFCNSGPDAGKYEVLWRGSDYRAHISLERPDNLRVFDRGDRAFRSASLAASALTDNPQSPLHAFVCSEPESLRERDARELKSLCTAVLSAEFPLAVHVIGSPHARAPIVETLSSRVAICTEGGLPQDDATSLRRHGCTPVIVVVDSENNPHLTRDLKELRKKGWEIIICTDSSMVLTDSYVEHAISDLPLLSRESITAVVDTTETPIESVSAAIEEVGARARRALDERVEQKGSYMGAQRQALNALADMLDGLAEADPSKAIARRPRDFHLVRSAIEEIRRGEIESALQIIERLPGQILAPSQAAHGATQTQQSWSFRELVQLSMALAKSRLPPSHPAVLLRGITCLDLSPAALAQLLEQGGQIFRHVDSSGVTRSMIISLPPNVTDTTRPGLSANLGHENKVGYIYWVWVDPDGTENIRAAYTKLLNRVALEQSAGGATFLFGRVLERNAPSLLAVRSIGGFEIMPVRAVIGGEPAIAVGVDLSLAADQDAERATTFTPRTIVEETLDVFTSGLEDPSIDEERVVALRLRAVATHEFLMQAYSFRAACENVLDFVNGELWWGDGNRIVERAEEALAMFAPWLSEQQRSDVEHALDMITEDGQREAGKRLLRSVLEEVLPEKLKTILANHNRVRQKVLHSLQLELDTIVARSNPGVLRQRAADVPLPPKIDIEAVRRSAEELPEQAKSILDAWYNRSGQKFWWVDDTHPNVYGCHRQLRGWIERDLERAGAFCSAPGFPDSRESEVSETVRPHFDQFAQLIEWANQVARAGHFDQHVARFILPLIEAFLGRRRA